MFSRIITLVQCMYFATSLVQAASSTSSNSMSGTSMASGVSMGGMNMSTTSTSVDNSPPYTITALPAVVSQNSCVFNCLIPIGMAGPSGCNNVTENCACLSAPVEAAAFLTDCVATVCKSSTNVFASSATSLYQSYCNSVYGLASLSAATAADEASDSAAAASSLISNVMTMTATTTSAGSTLTGTTIPSTLSSGSALPSSTGKSDAKIFSPPLRSYANCGVGRTGFDDLFVGPGIPGLGIPHGKRLLAGSFCGNCRQKYLLEVQPALNMPE